MTQPRIIVPAIALGLLLAIADTRHFVLFSVVPILLGCGIGLYVFEAVYENRWDWWR